MKKAEQMAPHWGGRQRRRHDKRLTVRAERRRAKRDPEGPTNRIYHGYVT